MSLFVGDQVSKFYNSVRPKLSSALVQRVFAYLNQSVGEHEWQSFLDIGCGTGLSTKEYLEALPPQVAVLGLDNSPSQIHTAQTITHSRANVAFKVHDVAKGIPAPDNSVDLINVTQAAHWLQLDVLMRESERALRPGGVLAINWYPLPQIHSAQLTQTQIQQANALVKKLNDDLRAGGFWASERLLVTEYKDHPIVLPFTEQLQLWNEPSIFYRKDSELCEFLHLFESWSAVRTYKEKRPQGAMIDQFYDKMRTTLAPLNDQSVITQVFPYILLMGRKKTD